MNAGERYKALCCDVAAIAERSGRDPDSITIVAISKQHSVAAIRSVYDAGCRHFGESRIQEALPKMAALSLSVNWHMVGHLQRNKASRAVAAFDWIHSVDTPALARKIAAADGRPRIFLQVNVSGEVTKRGLTPEEWQHELDTLLMLPHLTIQGMMMMAPFTDDAAALRHYFSRLRKFRDVLRKSHGLVLPDLSMGMSNDYPYAIEEGATIVRIGRAIFGS